MWASYIQAWKHYAVFEGRVDRKTFWEFFLITSLVKMVAWVWSIKLFMLYALVSLFPQMGMEIRRLHDTNRSGWWLLIDLVPLAGIIALIVWWAQPGMTGANRYGPPPTPGGLLSSDVAPSLPPEI